MKKKDNYWMLKIGQKYNPKFIKSKFDYIIEQRIKNGKNKMSDLRNHILTYPRVLLAVMRHDKLVNDLINADFIDERNFK